MFAVAAAAIAVCRACLASFSSERASSCKAEFTTLAGEEPQHITEWKQLSLQIFAYTHSGPLCAQYPKGPLALYIPRQILQR